MTIPNCTMSPRTAKNLRGQNVDNYNSAFFRFKTLYQAQKETIWKRYDLRWSLFEQNHLKNEVPIPPSAKFLLIHLAFKLFDDRKLHREMYDMQAS